MVAQPVLDAMSHPLVDHRGPEFAAMLARLIDALRPVFGTTGEIAVLGSSGTGALEAAVVNLFSPGERLLSCAVGAFGKRLAAIARAYGCEVEALETPPGAALDPQALRARLEADTDRRIDGVLLTQNETSTGVANDMAAIAPIVRAHGALTIVDAVSGLGASEFKMDEWGFDAVASASQKAFAAPPGVGIIALSARGLARCNERRMPRFYFDLGQAFEFARKGQTPWTPPISVLFALDVALQRYHAVGMSHVFARHTAYAQEVRETLQRAGFRLFSHPGAHSDTVVAVYPPENVAIAAMLKALRDRDNVVISDGQGELSGKIVRFGTMGDFTHAELETALDAVVRAANALTRDVAGSTA
jgi:aspartate aminotransferase-like enzyme